MKNINESKNPTPKSNSKLTLEVLIGVTSAIVAKTNKILKILDPIILPTTIPGFLCFAAAKEVTNSGSEVPNATANKEMIVSGI
mgnify:CR=1 FL=1